MKVFRKIGLTIVAGLMLFSCGQDPTSNWIYNYDLKGTTWCETIVTLKDNIRYSPQLMVKITKTYKGETEEIASEKKEVTTIYNHTKTLSFDKKGNFSFVEKKEYPKATYDIKLENQKDAQGRTTVEYEKPSHILGMRTDLSMLEKMNVAEPYTIELKKIEGQYASYKDSLGEQIYQLKGEFQSITPDEEKAWSGNYLDKERTFHGSDVFKEIETTNFKEEFYPMSGYWVYKKNKNTYLRIQYGGEQYIFEAVK